MDLLRHIVFFYFLLGVFISGGLFFKKRTPANISLALFVFLFSFETLDFIYTTGVLISFYPDYFLFVYPVCLLFGPALWLHLNFINNPSLRFSKKHLLHIVPFLLFILIFLIPLYRLSGVDRINFAQTHFLSRIMPLNYIRTTHVLVYGLLMLFFIIKQKLFRKGFKGMYVTILTFIYFFTAVFQSYLTLFADSYRQFVFYFFLANSTVLLIGYILYFHPEVFIQFQKKYFSSGLNQKDKKRIINKINTLLEENPSFIVDNSLNLKKFSDIIGEKQNYISQVFSEEFNCSFTDFVNKNRVLLAERILKDPSKDCLKILAVAYECGFNNSVTFNKAFVKFIGITPGKYRKLRKDD